MVVRGISWRLGDEGGRGDGKGEGEGGGRGERSEPGRTDLADEIQS